MNYLLVLEYADCSNCVRRFDTLEDAEKELRSLEGDETIEYAEIVEYQSVKAWYNPDCSPEKDF